MPIVNKILLNKIISIARYYIIMTRKVDLARDVFTIHYKSLFLMHPRVLIIFVREMYLLFFDLSEATLFTNLHTLSND